MRTSDASLRERLRTTLRAQPRSSARVLANRLGVSLQTVRRLLDEMPRLAWVRAGQARRVRYALRRSLRGSNAELPLYAVDADGRAQYLTSLVPLQPQGTLASFARGAWPIPAESRDGWWDGLPYPVYAMRPQGYLGRQFARARAQDLGVAPDPNVWTDDDVLWVLAQCGADTVGNLILGDVAYQAWQQARRAGATMLTAGEIGAAYLRYAEDAVRGGGAGSNAAGEFPKFAALRKLAGALTPHVLVKFSGAGESLAERRWADLLVCEDIALHCAVRLSGVHAARSRTLTHAGRTFLELERFDRVGAHGRLAVIALDAIAPAFLGAPASDWPGLAAGLHAQGCLDAASLAAIERLWWYGRLIANSDMHLGNLSFFVDQTFRLAPTYDMLPMFYAPLPGGELPQREFSPPLPLPQEREVWQAASEAACAFWEQAAQDARIGSAFRGICEENLARLRAAAEHA